MSTYAITAEADARCYPNYSFEVGDVTGDGRAELVALNQTGNRLRVMTYDGELVFERRLHNNGNWSSVVPGVADIDGDGRAEVVVPDQGRENRHKYARVVALNADGEVVAERMFDETRRDDYGITVPLIAPFRYSADSPLAVVVALSGGTVLALDGQFNELWRRTGFRNDFGHEFYVADVDGDGWDEIAFCTLDHIDGGDAEWNRGDLVILDHDGSEILRRPTHDLYPDSHFDDIAFADFLGRGDCQMLIEKGLLCGLDGEILWRIDGDFDHAQWIAHTPDPANPDGPRRVLLTELWTEGRFGAVYSGDGTRIAGLENLPWTSLDPYGEPGWHILPTRPHAVDWRGDGSVEFFVAEQVCAPTSHEAFETRSFELKAFILDIEGNLVATVPFEDSQIEGYWYNGEVRSRALDVDGGDRREVVFPRQNGRVAVFARTED